MGGWGGGEWGVESGEDNNESLPIHVAVFSPTPHSHTPLPRPTPCLAWWGSGRKRSTNRELKTIN